MTTTSRATILALAAAAAGSAAGQWCEHLEALPLLPGTIHGEANAVSRDGRFVVGTGILPSRVGIPFLWTREGGMVPLAYGPGVVSAYADAVSEDGSVVAGSCTHAGRIKLFRWTSAGGMVVLGDFGASQVSVSSISGDGSVIVGHLTFNNLVRAFRWTVADGLDILADTFSHARAITHDGQTIAGHAEQPGQSFTTCLWDASGTLQPLDLGEPRAAIFGMTDDAEVFVGEEVIPPPFSASLAIRWSQARGYEQLTDYSHVAHAYDLSADGSVVIGTQEDVPGVARACLWTGAQDLHYINPDRLHTSVANEVSADGGTIVGTLTNADGTRRAFVWTGFELGADFNRDGFVDFFDYDDYVRCFESADCPAGTAADFNHDGFSDFFDYDAFVAAFETGC